MWGVVFLSTLFQRSVSHLFVFALVDPETIFALHDVGLWKKKS
jgi:hypothetical protein